MALEAVVFPQDLFGYTMKELYSLEGVWGFEFGGLEEEEEKKKGGTLLGCGIDGERGKEQSRELLLDEGNANWSSSCNFLVHNFEEWDANSSSPETGCFPGVSEATTVVAGRRKRQRTKRCKNKEEVENQRMTHIAVERNRRKQMNEYLGVLRSLMPPSYVQRGDQASIIGGAINFVKELEQLQQSLEAQKIMERRPGPAACGGGGSSSPFADFFAFPQYSSLASRDSSTTAASASSSIDEMRAGSPSGVADIEVTMVESHANLKILSRRRPKQLLKMVVGLQNLRLTTLHLNVTTVDQMVLYSFSLKVEEDCEFRSVDEIATAVYRLVERIQEEAVLTN